jgi:hypothetical protein
MPTVSGPRALMRTKGGQQLAVTTLLPADARPTAEPAEPLRENSEPAELDPMTARLRVESRARDVRFLHVLEGADGKATPDTPVLADLGADWVGVTVHARGAACGPGGGAKAPHASCALLVVFPRDAGDPPRALDGGGNGSTIALPGGTRAVLLTGLQPGGAYTSTRQADGRLRIASGGSTRADGGGALYIPIQ